MSLADRFVATPANHRFGFLKCWRNFNPVIKNETITFPVRTTAFLEITEDATVHLIDIFKPLLFKPRSGFLATHPAGTEGNQGFFRVQLLFSDRLVDSSRQVAKILDLKRLCLGECS